MARPGAALATLALVPACSFAFMRLPPQAPPARCATRLDAPLIDTVIAAIGFALTAYSIDRIVTRADGTSEQGGIDVAVVPAAYGIPIGLVFGASAAYGYYARHRCRQFEASPGR